MLQWSTIQFRRKIFESLHLTDNCYVTKNPQPWAKEKECGGDVNTW